MRNPGMSIRPRLRCVRARVTIVALAGALILSACSVLPPREVVQTWQPPEGAATAASGIPAPAFSLRVDTPNTSGMLDNTGIVVMPEPGRVSVYRGARWSESPALLVRHRLVDAFMAAGLPAVTTDDDRFASDYALSGDLRAFQSEYRNGSPVVVVRFDAQLRRGGARNLLATRSFVVTQNPSGTQVPQIVAAFGPRRPRTLPTNRRDVAHTRARLPRRVSRRRTSKPSFDVPVFFRPPPGQACDFLLRGQEKVTKEKATPRTRPQPIHGLRVRERPPGFAEGASLRLRRTGALPVRHPSDFPSFARRVRGAPSGALPARRMARSKLLVPALNEAKEGVIETEPFRGPCAAVRA